MYVSLNGTLTASRVPWPDFAHLAARTGYPGVDLPLPQAMKEGLAATRRLLADLKIKPAVVTLPVEFRKDDEAFRRDFDKLEDASQFSAAIGCPRMTTWIMSSSEIPKEELWQTYLRRFRACADVLARSHIRLGFEFLGPLHIRKRFPHEFIWRMNEMLAFARECGSNCGLLLDSWHWYHAGATLEDIVEAGRHAIVHVQLNDSPKLPPEEIRDNERLMPGEGVIDLDGFLKALKEIGYSDGISPEVFGRGLKDVPPEQGARLGLETTLAAMRKAGVA